MYRILTGLCCAVWCAVIAVEAFGLNKRQEMALDSFEMASCFNDEFTDDVTAQIRLYGTGPALTSEEEITEYLEGLFLYPFPPDKQHSHHLLTQKGDRQNDHYHEAGHDPRAR